jgi:hypothetical protein
VALFKDGDTGIKAEVLSMARSAVFSERSCHASVTGFCPDGKTARKRRETESVTGDCIEVENKPIRLLVCTCGRMEVDKEGHGDMSENSHVTTPQATDLSDRHISIPLICISTKTLINYNWKADLESDVSRYIDTRSNSTRHKRDQPLDDCPPL